MVDLNLPKDQSVNLMYCYCRNIFWSNLGSGSDPTSDLSEPFSDGKEHCKDWLKNYSVQKTLLFSVPLSIVAVTWVSKTVLRLLTRLEGH